MQRHVAARRIERVGRCIMYVHESMLYICLLGSSTQLGPLSSGSKCTKGNFFR